MKNKQALKHLTRKVITAPKNNGLEGKKQPTNVHIHT